MDKLRGKIAVITGGSSGLGLATARHFVAEGAYVFITGRRQAELDAAVKAIGQNVTGIRSDIAKLDDLDRLYEIVKREKGHIDVLFANAGVGSYAPIGSITEEHFDSIFDVNVKGTVFTVQKALPLLREGASVILNASVAGSAGDPEMSVYSASKAAIRSFARTWAHVLGKRKIRVNAISPGIVPTEGYSTQLGLDDGQIKSFVAGAEIPLGRPGVPDEIARAAAFLASDESSYITGIELFVDGGLSQAPLTSR